LSVAAVQRPAKTSPLLRRLPHISPASLPPDERPKAKAVKKENKILKKQQQQQQQQQSLPLQQQQQPTSQIQQVHQQHWPVPTNTVQQ
jgi:hypothetical protein